ncbi:MAG: hypothetical protein HQL82_13815 [Magnetococcales bacterium]|nr:hypothetical protein [Magnetococcales bacterium]
MTSLRKYSKTSSLGTPKPALAKPIDPEDAERLLSQERSRGRAAAPARKDRDGGEIHESLRVLVGSAQRERLEWMVPLVETLQMALALDRAKSGAPPGTLTVKGWMTLLNNWEKQLGAMPARQLDFGKDFVLEACDKATNHRSPLAPILRELGELMAKARQRIKGDRAAA